MDAFTSELLEIANAGPQRSNAWCVLPNHYHLLVETGDITRLLRELGRLHGRTSFQWNGEDEDRGRQVFFRATERTIRSDRHFWATINYIHNNPVHHGYVEQWSDWIWSSATALLLRVGTEQAGRIWRDYPILDYGKGWDSANL
jgi:putative transposase